MDLVIVVLSTSVASSSSANTSCHHNSLRSQIDAAWVDFRDWHHVYKGHLRTKKRHQRNSQSGLVIKKRTSNHNYLTILNFSCCNSACLTLRLVVVIVLPHEAQTYYCYYQNSPFTAFGNYGHGLPHATFMWDRSCSWRLSFFTDWNRLGRRAN